MTSALSVSAVLPVTTAWLQPSVPARPWRRTVPIPPADTPHPRRRRRRGRHRRRHHLPARVEERRMHCVGAHLPHRRPEAHRPEGLPRAPHSRVTPWKLGP